MEQDPSERRRRVRAPISVMGTVEGPGGEDPVVVLNLSASGAMVQADIPPQPDATYVLRFSLHMQAYELRFQAIHFVQRGDCYGWRGPFVDVSAEQADAIERVVKAAIGEAESSFRSWQEVLADAQREPAAKVSVGITPAGHEIAVAAQDVLEMGADGLELYARLMGELETI